jgi:hypothetical protein
VSAPADHRQLYGGALDAMLPGIRDDTERDYRTRLLWARDIATDNVAKLSGHPQTLNLLIVEVAGAFAFSSVGTDHLRQAVEQCRRLMSCAAGAERLDCGR